MADNDTTTPEQQIINLLQTTSLSDTEIGATVGVTRQKVSKVKTAYLQRGLGDKVADVLEATGINALVKWATDGKDCGCEERKQKLNIVGGYKVQKCLSRDQYEYLDRFFSTWSGTTSPTYPVLNELAKIRNDVFSLRYNQPNPMCPACVRGIIEPLRILHKDGKHEG